MAWYKFIKRSIILDTKIKREVIQSLGNNIRFYYLIILIILYNITSNLERKLYLEKLLIKKN